MTLHLGEETYRGPLTAAQQAVWVASKLASDPLYTIAFALVFEGGVDPETVNGALDRLVRRHDALRTTFTLENGEPVQAIHDLDKVDVVWSDATDSEGDGDAATSAMLRRQLEEMFDLDGQQALMRVNGVHLAAGRAALLVTVHHLCFDGGSIPIFVEELIGYLQGFPDQEPLETQYIDVAEWQQEQLAAGAWEQSRAYWLQHLSDMEVAGSPAAIRGGDRSQSGTTVEATMPQETSLALDMIARQHATSRFAVLAAALLLLLHRYTGQEDAAVGMPVSQHDRRPETRRMIGLLVNTVVLRAAVKPSTPFTTLLQEVRAEVLRALDHQDFPVEIAVRELQRGRSAPLFDVLLNYERTEHTGWLTSTGPVRLLGCEEREAKFPVTFYATDGPVCTIRVAFQTARHSPEQMRLVLSQYLELLRQVVADPERGIEDYSLHGSSAEVLADPAMALPRTPTVSVIERFLSVVAAAPDAIAVTEGDSSLTYAALAERSECIAEGLRAKGIGPSDVVAVRGRRGSDFIAVMIGVLRSGGAFLPIDSELPEARRQQLIAESGARAVMDATDGSILVCAASPEGESTSPAAERTLPDRWEPDQPCYVFFTSGTTGTPKPVVGVHAGLAHFIAWQAERFNVGPGDRVAQLTSIGFDPFLRDVLLPLTTGATLCIPPPRLGPSEPGILGWLVDQRVTILHAVPSLAKWWLTSDGAPKLPALRWTFFAGEPLSSALVEQWRACLPQSGQIVNLYGPTETTQAVCHHLVREPPDAGVQPVGRSIPDTQVLVLAPNGRRCAVGEVGEICVRSPFRSSARDPRSGLLLSGFFANPYRDDPDDLIYHSGDLGRVRPDGVLEILGRRDHQIKINGVRIDPNEIAATLEAHQAVADCVVHRWRAEDDTTFLAAYVTRAGAADPSPSELRRLAGERLPRVMVPSTITVLDRIPVTVNGKVDRRALPRPEQSPRAGGRLARTPAESRVCAMMADLLRRPVVHADDDFFMLGGHSLIMIQLIVRIEDEFGVRLAFDEVFRRPTPQELAELLPEVNHVEPPTREMGARAAVEVSLDNLAEDEMEFLLAALRGGGKE